MDQVFPFPVLIVQGYAILQVVQNDNNKKTIGFIQANAFELFSITKRGCFADVLSCRFLGSGRVCLVFWDLCAMCGQLAQLLCINPV